MPSLTPFRPEVDLGVDDGDDGDADDDNVDSSDVSGTSFIVFFQSQLFHNQFADLSSDGLAAMEEP